MVFSSLFSLRQGGKKESDVRNTSILSLLCVCGWTAFHFCRLLANICDPKTKKPVLNLLPSGMVHWQGYKIGVIGLGEEEWLETLTCIDMEQVETILGYCR